jgi:hypothetical protein
VSHRPSGYTQRGANAARIDVKVATDKLLADGVDLFVRSFDGVVGIVEKRRAARGVA